MTQASRVFLAAITVLTVVPSLAYGVSATPGGQSPAPTSQQVVTEDYAARFKGIVAVRVLKPALDSNADPCGIDAESIRLAAARSFLDGGIRVIDDDDKVTVAVSLIISIQSATIQSGEVSFGCAAAISVSISTMAPTRLPNRNLPNTWVFTRLPVDIDRIEILIVDSGKNLGRTLPTETRQIVDKFVTRIKLANQR